MRTQYIAGLLFLTWAGPRLFAVIGGTLRDF